MGYLVRRLLENAANEGFLRLSHHENVDIHDRAQLLDRLADRLTADRLELAALQCWEVAKPRREAGADVAEAVDFCRYYTREALVELAPRKQGSVPGEDNVLWYEGRGPCAVISPWNFPLAILCGMSTAALVAGNPVLIKPSSQSAAIAYGLYQRMIQAGFPPDVVHFLPGSGRIVGARSCRASQGRPDCVHRL